ncbi:MAG: bile acid:sodium symporter family protein, partial [Candidatus Omnitrophica bacterium]|nr:bile acid:sodium symporter family protein [Candidatus Omnitrophota bacterium]
TRLLVLWVIIAGITGYLYPPALVVFKPHLDWLFAFTMFGIGAILKTEDFKPVFKKPHFVLLGTLAQFGIMPALGFLIAKFLKLPPELALGVILAGSVPGAMASNVISYLAKADVAYSVALTTASTLLAPIFTPFFTYLFAKAYIEIPVWPMFFSIIKMVLLPLFAGFTLKFYFKSKVNRFIEVFPAVSVLFIAFICGLVVALNRDYIAHISLLIFVAVLLHNFFGLVLGYGAGALYRFDKKRKRTLALEVGMQNAGLGAVLALKHFTFQSALPAALFATWCIITASILAEIWSRDKSLS